MSLLRRTVPMLALVGMSVGSLAAQIPINRGRSGPANAAAPRLLVATPYTERGSDSATAVTIGAALRTRFGRVVGNTFFVIPRDQMNRALGEFAYPADAILNRENAYRLTTAMQARTMLFTDLLREQGRYRARARLSTGADDPGNTIVVVQAPGQSLQDFGEAVANAFQPVVLAQNDAKACMDQMQSDPRKAGESAAKALRAYPAHGLAHYCLAQMAKARGAADPAYATELDLTIHGDSLSLKALGELADVYNTRGDTSNVILKYQQMIEAAPTNRALIEQASKVFRSFGRPDAAERVADRGIALDSLDTPMWDLRSSACLYQNKYTCSVQSLEQIIAIDSARAADSNFVFRVAITAGALFAAGDTTTWKDSTALKASFLKWSQEGVRRWPTNKNLLGQLLNAYSVNGMTDQVLATTDQVVALDSTDVTPVLPAIEILIGLKRWADVAKYGAVVQGHGDDQQKLAIAANFTNSARALLTQQPTDPEAAYNLLHVAIPSAGTDARIAPSANFLMGYAGLLTVNKYDAQAEQLKSCDLARRMDAMLDEARAGFTTGESVNPSVVPQQLNNIAQYKQRTQTMIRAYCR
jgi:tetratricopeptide (TPR) repeat protein